MTLHSVRRRGTPLEGRGGALTLEADVFERQVESLARAGYRGITCAELHDHLTRSPASRTQLPKKPVMFAFDDGYLDNWTVACPILKGHGMRATIFVATDFLETGERARPTTNESGDAPELGFLNAAELRELERSGVFEVQAHSAAHARHASQPGESSWFGEAPRYFAESGRFETEAEQRSRIASDLKRCRATLATVLGHAVDFLAWPGGGTSPVALDVALNAVGFRATFGTDRRCVGVEPSPRAIPRAFFSQSYRGPLADFARVQKLRGVVDFERGSFAGYLRIFCANRVMQLFGRSRDEP